MGCTVKKYWRVDFVVRGRNCDPSSLEKRQVYLVTGGKKSSYKPWVKHGDVVEIWSEFDKNIIGKHEVIDIKTGTSSGTVDGPSRPASCKTD